MRGLDLFSGPGGLTLGLKAAGITTVAAVEKNANAVATFQQHSPKVKIFCDDVRRVDLKPFNGIDLIYGGPPCQPFSTGGLRRATNDARNMVPAFLEAVASVEPGCVLMENVPGLATRKRISYLYELLDRLWELGYQPNWRIVSSADFGVPQQRKRLFVIAYRGHQFWFPRPTHGPGCVQRHVSTESVVGHEPLGEPPDCPVVFAKYPDIRRSPYAGHVYNGGGRPIDLTKPSPTILASAGGYKTHWIDTEGVAPRYHAHLAGGGDPWVGEVPGARRLTVEESAAIQTFPSDLKFSGSRSAQYTQVGDAVPPRLAEFLGREVMAQLIPGQVDPSTHFEPEVHPTLFAETLSSAS